MVARRTYKRPGALRRKYRIRRGRRPLGFRARNPVADMAAGAAAAGFSSLARRYWRNRANSGAIRRNRRREDAPVPVEIGEVTARKRVTGRYRRPTLRNAFRLIKNLSEPLWVRYGGANQYCTVNAGYFKLYNHYNTAGNAHTPPVNFFDLTALFNMNGGSTVNGGPVGTSIYTSGGAMTFEERFGNFVNNQTNYVMESAPDSTIQLNTPLRDSLLKYVDIRMLCYGTTTCPVRYEISLVKFRDWARSPTWATENTTFPWTLNDATTVSMYQYLTRQFEHNPIESLDPKMREKFTILHTESFTLQSTTSIEGSSTVPHMKRFHHFLKLDKIQKYDWGEQAYNAVNLHNSAIMPQSLGYMKPNVHYKDRIFLVVRAQSVYTTGATAPSWDIRYNPSFDLSIRKRYEITT